MKKIKLYDKNSLIQKETIVIIKKFRHSMSNELMYIIRRDSIGAFGGSLSKFEILSKEHLDLVLRNRVKKWPDEI